MAKLSTLDPKLVVIEALEYAVEVTWVPTIWTLIAAAWELKAKSVPTELTTPPADFINLK